MSPARSRMKRWRRGAGSCTLDRRGAAPGLEALHGGGDCEIEVGDRGMRDAPDLAGGGCAMASVRPSRASHHWPSMSRRAWG